VPELYSATNHVGDAHVCDNYIADTMPPTSEAIRNMPSDPCFVTSPVPSIELEVTLADGSPPVCTLTLIDAQIVGRYDDATAPTRLDDGMVRAFLTEDNAKACVVNQAMMCGGGQSLYQIFDAADGCGNDADRDIRNGKAGWWFYANLTAERVEWSEP